MNVRIPKEDKKTYGKPFKKPYRSTTNSRFTWIKFCLLAYFEYWKAKVDARLPVELTKTERSEIVILRQSFVECVTIFIGNGICSY